MNLLADETDYANYFYPLSLLLIKLKKHGYKDTITPSARDAHSGVRDKRLLPAKAH
jgi:hypothetical protein